jgi:hypothetical protein
MDVGYLVVSPRLAGSSHRQQGHAVAQVPLLLPTGVHFNAFFIRYARSSPRTLVRPSHSFYYQVHLQDQPFVRTSPSCGSLHERPCWAVCSSYRPGACLACKSVDHGVRVWVLSRVVSVSPSPTPAQAAGPGFPQRHPLIEKPGSPRQHPLIKKPGSPGKSHRRL